MRHDGSAGRGGGGSFRHAGRAAAMGLPGNPAFSLGLIGLTIWFLLLSCGCSANGRTVILRPSESDARYSSVLVKEDGSDPLVPPGVSRDFRMALSKHLYDRGAFVHGPQLRIVYRITGYPAAPVESSAEGKEDPGPGAITVEVRFYNFVEKEIASIRAEGDAGDTGRIDGAVRECARQVALYAKQNFR